MNWKAETIFHNGVPRIAVYFDKNAVLISRIKTFEDARWSPEKKYWHLPDNKVNRIHFKIPLVITLVPSLEGRVSMETFKQYLYSKRYSENTIKTYINALKSFLLFYREKSISELTNQHVIVYNNNYILKNNLSASYQNQIANALKLFFKICRETKIEIDKIHRPKRAKILPNVLSKEEVKLVLQAHSNIKHKMMLSLIYSCGLRSGELLALNFLLTIYCKSSAKSGLI